MKRSYTKVKCIKCGKEWLKETFDIKKWRGQCKSCAKLGNTIATGNKGKPKSAEHRKNMSGPNHARWKGGVTPINHQIRTSFEYKLWRKSVFERDKYTCIWCKARNGNGKSVTLQADHIQPFSTHPELRFAIDNGRTLCKPCHIKRHRK